MRLPHARAVGFVVFADLRENTQVSAFRNFRINILHGDKDNVIPWTMGFELFNTLASMKRNLGLTVPINVNRSISPVLARSRALLR